MTGYTTVGFSTNKKDRTVVETSEDELKSLMPDSFEGNWRDNRRKFTLDSNGEIIFEKDYQPDEKVAE